MTLPFSTAKHNDWVNSYSCHEILEIQPKLIFDIGIGDGYWCKLVKFFFDDTNITGIELNEKWFNYCEELKIYDKIILDSIVNQITNISGDLIIFGDILEHLEKDDMKYVLKEAVQNFKYILINGPVGFVPQFHEDTEEIHRSGITREDFNDYKIKEYHEGFVKEVNFSMMNCLLYGKNT